MWCVGNLTEEYRERMYDLLDLYARPFRSREPIICLDENAQGFAPFLAGPARDARAT